MNWFHAVLILALAVLIFLLGFWSGVLGERARWRKRVRDDD